MNIAEQVDAVRAEIATICNRVGRDPAQVRLIAVTKSQGPAVLPALAACGVLDVGENRLDHQQEMMAAAPAGMRFHAIGRLQGRQLPKLAAASFCLHGLCDLDHIRRLGQAVAILGRRLPIFLQVNTSGEASKAGLDGDHLPAAIDLVARFPGLDLQGLMTMAPEHEEGASESAIRSCFAAARALAERHHLPRLSMGMSQDFAWAVAEGATDIRIGTRLFR